MSEVFKMIRSHKYSKQYNNSILSVTFYFLIELKLLRSRIKDV